MSLGSTTKGVNVKALELIKKYEGCKLEAYKCPSGVWTIGFGHTGSDVYKGVKISKEEAEILLEKEFKKLKEQVNFLLNVSLNEKQVGALTSLVYNVGLGAFKKSKLLKRINNSDNLELIAKEWLEFNKVNGKILRGLLKRRIDEIALYLE